MLPLCESDEYISKNKQLDDICSLSCVPMSSSNETKSKVNNDKLWQKKRREKILVSRGAFKWLPVFCSNDLVHGSWWFVWGSVFGTVISIFPLCSEYIPFFKATDTTLPVLELPSTWGLLISSGVFFTLGSLAFVRAFEDPPLEPLFRSYYHFSTDELLGAWLYLLGTIPAVPYSTVFIFHDPSEVVYWGGFVASIGFVICTSIFVVVSYPSAKALLEPMIQPFAQRLCGNTEWVHRHLATDWLAATWCFLYATLLWMVSSVVLLLIDCWWKKGEELFVWMSSLIDAVLFLVGCVYFVAGSYPHNVTNSISPNYDHCAEASTHSHVQLNNDSVRGSGSSVISGEHKREDVEAFGQTETGLNQTINVLQLPSEMKDFVTEDDECGVSRRTHSTTTTTIREEEIGTKKSTESVSCNIIYVDCHDHNDRTTSIGGKSAFPGNYLKVRESIFGNSNTAGSINTDNNSSSSGPCNNYSNCNDDGNYFALSATSSPNSSEHVKYETTTTIKNNTNNHINSINSSNATGFASNDSSSSSLLANAEGV